MMGIVNMVDVELAGVAVVRINKIITLPAEKAKKVLADDELIKSVLAKGQPFKICEWDVVFGERKPIENKARA